jgi:endonuclease/exonuclease/phosphatase family metal-dependent hydrolase
MKNKRKFLMQGLAIVLAIMISPVNSGAISGEITVMTRNMYVGIDIFAVAEAEDFETAATNALFTAAARYRARVNTLAAEIAETKPHLVALQEVYSFTLNGYNLGPPYPFIDFLGDPAGAGEGLLSAIATLGADYYVAASVKNVDIPFHLPGLGDVRATDRDVILARWDVAAEAVDLSELCRVSEDGCNYGGMFHPILPPIIPEFEIVVERGVVAVHAVVDGLPLLFVNTHLETKEFGTGFGLPHGFFQALQGIELIQLLHTLNDGSMPIIVAGDFNSDPRDDYSYPLGPFKLAPPYRQLVDAGLLDAWLLHRPGNPRGFTCCQDEDLLNQRSALDERVDLIFISENPSKTKVDLVGEQHSDKAPTGLWPSDHAGVVSTITFE